MAEPESGQHRCTLEGDQPIDVHNISAIWFFFGYVDPHVRGPA